MAPLDINLHLGDNPNFYEPVKWSGLTATLPVMFHNIGDETAKLLIETSEMQTLAEWQAHRVTLDGFHIGFIKGLSSGKTEIHEMELPNDLIKIGTAQKLVIEVVGRGPGLEDDFILKSIATVGVDISLGW